MAKCSTCGIDLQLGWCPDCRRRPLRSAGGTWALYILLLTPGVFISLQARAVYPLLDSRLPMALILGGFILPVMLQLLSFLRRNQSADVGPWRILYICSGLFLV